MFSISRIRFAVLLVLAILAIAVPTFAQDDEFQGETYFELQQKYYNLDRTQPSWCEEADAVLQQIDAARPDYHFSTHFMRAGVHYHCVGADTTYIQESRYAADLYEKSLELEFPDVEALYAAASLYYAWFNAEANELLSNDLYQTLKGERAKDLFFWLKLQATEIDKRDVITTWIVATDSEAAYTTMVIYRYADEQFIDRALSVYPDSSMLLLWKAIYFKEMGDSLHYKGDLTEAERYYSLARPLFMQGIEIGDALYNRVMLAEITMRQDRERGKQEFRLVAAEFGWQGWRNYILSVRGLDGREAAHDALVDLGRTGDVIPNFNLADSDLSSYLDLMYYMSPSDTLEQKAERHRLSWQADEAYRLAWGAGE